jgi:hypothetical protein
MNKDLYGNTVQLPEDVVEYLQQCFDSANTDDTTIEGHKRNQELRDSREVTYQQLKRMKNWFDNFNGLENDLPFILNVSLKLKDLSRLSIKISFSSSTSILLSFLPFPIFPKFLPNSIYIPLWGVDADSL